MHDVFHLSFCWKKTGYELFQEFKKLNKEVTKFYKCSNGHLYTIGDCTKPAVTGKCPTCGDTIGGADHQLAAGNTAATDLILTIFSFFFEISNLKIDERRCF